MGAHGPVHANLLAWSSYDVVAGSWTRTASSANFTGALLVSTSVINSEVTYSVALARGEYVLNVFFFSNTNRGIATVSVDGVSFGTVDMYSSPSANNGVVSLTGDVLFGGEHLVSLKMASKHASSSGYIGSPSLLAFRRTGP